MIKKIIKLFKRSKKIKNKNILKKNKQAEIINFSTKRKSKNKFQIENIEIKKMDNLAKELVDSYLKASRRSFLDTGYCFYLFLFRLLQRMVFQFSYPVYRHFLKTTSKEIANNHKEWLHTFEEWKEKLDEDKNTLH